MPLYVKAAQAALHYNTSISNVRKWARDGTIQTQKTPKGHYIYIIPSDDDTTTDHTYSCIIYSRVSSKKQQADLKRQSKVLKTAYPTYTLVEDIGSGINYKRPGFKTILEELFAGNVKRVVVAHSDRFSRFGFDFFQWLFAHFGATLESMADEEITPEEDLAQDIMEVFTVFTARYYGKRKYATTKHTS